MKAIMIILALFIIIGGGWFIGKAAVDIEKYKNCDHTQEVFGIVLGVFAIMMGVMFIWLSTVIF